MTTKKMTLVVEYDFPLHLHFDWEDLLETVMNVIELTGSEVVATLEDVSEECENEDGEEVG